jgi:hypothetical protein
VMKLSSCGGFGKSSKDIYDDKEFFIQSTAWNVREEQIRIQQSVQRLFRVGGVLSQKRWRSQCTIQSIPTW